MKTKQKSSSILGLYPALPIDYGMPSHTASDTERIWVILSFSLATWDSPVFKSVIAPSSISLCFFLFHNLFVLKMGWLCLPPFMMLSGSPAFFQKKKNWGGGGGGLCFFVCVCVCLTFRKEAAPMSPMRMAIPWIFFFSPLAGIWGECSTIQFHSPLFFFFFSGDKLAHTNSIY